MSEQNMEEENALTSKENEASLAVIEKLHSGIIALIESDNVSVYRRIEEFRTLLDKSPKKELLRKHPYINSRFLPISHIEGLMDTLFFRQWGSENFRTELHGNEIVGNIDVWYIDPITDRKITRTGSAGVQVMVNALDKEKKKDMSKEEISMHSLDLMNNKKSNALETGYPKLKAQAFKNACSTIGAVFGRDVNREVAHVPISIIPQNFDAIKTVIKDEKGKN